MTKKTLSTERDANKTDLFLPAKQQIFLHFRTAILLSTLPMQSVKLLIIATLITSEVGFYKRKLQNLLMGRVDGYW